MQRHALCRAVHGRFKGGLPEDDRQSFIERINTPNFPIELEHANANPTSRESKELSAYIERHLKPVASAVPWSDEERKAELGKLLALIQRYGPPSFFCTVNPCDMDSSAMLRMSKFGSTTAYECNFGLPDMDQLRSATQRAFILADSPVRVCCGLLMDHSRHFGGHL